MERSAFRSRLPAARGPEARLRRAPPGSASAACREGQKSDGRCLATGRKAAGRRRRRGRGADAGVQLPVVAAPGKAATRGNDKCPGGPAALTASASEPGRVRGWGGISIPNAATPATQAGQAASHDMAPLGRGISRPGVAGSRLVQEPAPEADPDGRATVPRNTLGNGPRGHRHRTVHQSHQSGFEGVPKRSFLRRKLSGKQPEINN